MLERIRDILKDYTETPLDAITPESLLSEDLGLNSLDLMSVIVAFEDAFDIEISEEDALLMHRVSDIEQYICGLIHSDK